MEPRKTREATNYRHGKGFKIFKKRFPISKVPLPDIKEMRSRRVDNVS
jgi:hypothetical protein